jgi:hypothetical protein
MIKESLNAVADSARATFRGWRGLLLLAALYFALLASPYLFFSTGQATFWQLAVSALTAAVTPLLLFVLLAATAHFALPEPKTTGALARRSLRDFWKLLLLALPVAALAVLVFYLLGKLQQYLPKIEEAPHAVVSATGESRPAPLHWQETLLSTLRILLFGVVLPLLAAQLWLSAARDGFVRTVKRIHRVAGRAFAPRPVLVYAAGLFVFAMLPYFVLYTRRVDEVVSNGWGELFIFGLRLASAFALTLLGWTITLGALARVTPGDAHAVETTPAEPAPADAPHAAELPAPPSAATGEA